MHNELTRQDLKMMREELDYRRITLRPKLLEAVKEARAFGDLSENFEYKAAKREKNRNDSRVEWCACFVSWCYNQAGKSEPRFAGCEWQGVPWFQSHGQWGARGYENIAPGDAIFFDWDLDGSADHVGIVVGTDGSRVYTVEGNSGDACKIKSYSLTYECIKGYGLMNW